MCAQVADREGDVVRFTLHLLGVFGCRHVLVCTRKHRCGTNAKARSWMIKVPASMRTVATRPNPCGGDSDSSDGSSGDTSSDSGGANGADGGGGAG
jgi:uncharacterized membrane protein YgcG